MICLYVYYNFMYFKRLVDFVSIFSWHEKISPLIQSLRGRIFTYILLIYTILLLLFLSLLYSTIATDMMFDLNLHPCLEKHFLRSFNLAIPKMQTIKTRYFHIVKICILKFFQEFNKVPYNPVDMCIRTLI